jgi:calcineurin-like phosphoesterase family protein
MGTSKTNCRIWFSSDFHYGHKNICRGISEWTDKETTARDFETLDQMNYRIVRNINNVIMPNDILYFLGDWSFGGIENLWKFRKQIYCETIHFIIGNHDKSIKKNKQLPNCWWSNSEMFLDADTDHVGLQVCAESLFTSVQDYLEIVLEGQIFVLSHYPIEEWFEMDRKGAIMLHGHCHHVLDNHNLNKNYKRMDVGIDWHDFRPYEIKEILSIMKNRPNKTHNS